LYSRYLGNDGNYDLGKYDGTNLTIVSSPVGYENNTVGYNPPRAILGSSLYMRFQGNDLNYDLGKYDGSTLTIIPSPAGYQNANAGFQPDEPIIIGGTMYLRYLGDDGNGDLAAYDGTNLSIVPSPSGYDGNGYGYTGSGLQLGGVLYMQFRGNDGNYDLAKYDGSTLTIVSSPAGYENLDRGYVGSPVAIGSTLYLKYYGNDSNYDLAKYDGTTLTLVPSPAGYQTGTGYSDSPIAAGSVLYMRYRDNAGNYDLAKYDGTTLSLIASPTGYQNTARGYWTTAISPPIASGGTVYMQYRDNAGNFDLGIYDGTALTLVSSPAGFENAGRGYIGHPLLAQGVVYMQYQGNDTNFDLARCDGTTLTLIASPTGYENASHGYTGQPYSVGSVLYLQYRGNDTNSDLGKYDGATLTLIASPTGYHSANYGYYGPPLSGINVLYMRYRDTGANYDLMLFTEPAEITVLGNSVSIADGDTSPDVSDHTDFDNVVLGNNLARTFTIQNSGSASLTISSITSNNAKFAVSGAPTSIGGSSSATFTVTYTPTTAGIDNATITVNNSDSNEGVYDFVVQGTGEAIPEINLQGNSVSIADGDSSPSTADHTEFGSIDLGNNLARTFTIQNTGTASLTISDVTSDNAKFDISGAPTSVSASSSATFTVTYTPTISGNDIGTITVANSDSDEGVYDFVVQGTGVAIPEINLQGNSVSIADGDLSPSASDHTAFGSIDLGNNLARIFTIQNTGTASLSITSVLSNDSKFVVSGAPTTVGAGGTATFTLTYTPTTAVTDNATITINNSDSDEAVYDFAVQGTGVVVPVPEIDLQGNGMSIADGNATPSATDHTDFGSVDLGSNLARTFTIQNAGTATLSISSISSDDANFVVTGAPPSVAASSSQTFEVTFTPTTVGSDVATITVNSNDGDEAIYNFTIQGTGVAPEINLQGNNANIADGDASPDAADHTSFGDVTLGNNLVRTFTIQNTGTALLTVSGITSDNTKFLVSGAPSSVGSAGSSTFSITYTPTSAGADNATITVNNNDGDEGTYDFAILGTGVAFPEIDVQGNSVSIADGDVSPTTADHTDFGSVDLGNNLARTFTIQNSGTASLSISTINSSNAKFVVSGAPTNVATSGSATFVVTYTPTTTGTDNATITVNNNDSDEGTYSFDIVGLGTVLAVPEIDVTGNSISITDGDLSPAVADHTDFGIVDIGNNAVRTYTIHNTGTASLAISGISTDNPKFVISGAPASVGPAGSATFTVTYTPATASIDGATITISNTDGNEATYDFAIQGTGVVVTDLDNHINAEIINVYPNPSKGRFRIALDQPSQDAVASIVDMHGREAYRAKLSASDNSIEGNFSPGVYLLHILSHGKTRIVKLVIN